MPEMMRRTLPVLFAVSCLATTQPEPLPEPPANLGTCLVGAAERRVACREHRDCERDASEGWGRRCYAHLYRSAADDAEVRMGSHGPCFWDRGLADAEAPASEEARATFKEELILSTCAELALPALLERHCRDALRYAIDDLCQRGDVWLTGAGP